VFVAYQFVRVQTLSLKSGGGISAEAARVPDFCRHVERPGTPELLRGVGPEAAWSEIEKSARKARNVYTNKHGEQVTRAIRKDQAVALTAVASYPIRVVGFWDQTIHRFHKSL
jgi:hypothetical protein